MRRTIAAVFACAVIGAAAAIVFLDDEATNQVGKPQTPKPPFPYAVEEIFVDTPDGAARLAGSLTIPHGAGPHPAVVLLSVAGPTDRDQSFAGHKGFLVLADRLTREGYAVARFDDRGAGASTGDYFDASWRMLADDAVAITERLAGDPRIDHARIGLAGMSQGGAVAALAAHGETNLAFIILMSAPGLPGQEALALQLEKTIEASGIDGERAEKYRGLFRDYMGIVTGDPVTEETRDRLRRFLQGPGRALIPPYGFLPRDDEGLINVLLGRWYRSNLFFDPATTYGDISVPTLIIGGGKDFIAPADINVPAIERQLAGAPAASVTTIVIPGLNHLLQDAETGLPTEYASLKSSFSTAAMDEIVKWLNGLN